MNEYSLPIYHDPKQYDDEYWWKKDDIEFWKNHYLKHSKGTVLELGCGTGRIGIPLIKEGIQYSGIDISSEFLSHMRLKLIKNDLNANLLLNTDMRYFNINNKFDFIFIGFNSLLHLLTNSDIMLCLQQVKKHCHKKTIFCIDIFVPHPLFLYRPEVRYPLMEYNDSKSNEIIYIEELSKYNRRTEVIEVTWFYSSINIKDIKKYTFNMRMLYPDTLNRLLIDAGFLIKSIYGDYDYREFNEDSNKQIYDCIMQ